MNQPVEFEKPNPNPPHPADPPNSAWIDTGTMYVPIDVHVDLAEPETGIFLPPSFHTTGGSLNIILYFHGNKDPAKGLVGKPIRTIWGHQNYPFRTLLQTSGANYVMVAPTLGDVGNRSQGDFTSKKGAVGFMDQVLEALTNFGPYSMAPGVARLILAAHSGGGFYLKKALPFYEEEYGVDEVWAFDCLYDTTTPICAPDPYRICQQANSKWPGVPHTHTKGLTLDAWKSSIQGTVEHTLATWGAKGKKLVAYWNAGSGTAIRSANLALLSKLNNLANTKVLPDFYSGAGDAARPKTPPLATPVHDDIPRLKMPDCLAAL